MRDLACRFSVKRLKSCCKAPSVGLAGDRTMTNWTKYLGSAEWIAICWNSIFTSKQRSWQLSLKTLRLIGLSRILSYTNYESGKFHSLGPGSTLGEKHWSEASREVVYLTPFSAFFPHCGAWSLGTNSKAFTCKVRDNTTHHSKGLITWAWLADFFPVIT